jgi:hypothetical protein
MAYTLEYTAYYYQQHPSASKGFSGSAILGLIFIIIAATIVCSDSTYLTTDLVCNGPPNLSDC